MLGFPLSLSWLDPSLYIPSAKGATQASSISCLRATKVLREEWRQGINKVEFTLTKLRRLLILWKLCYEERLNSCSHSPGNFYLFKLSSPLLMPEYTSGPADNLTLESPAAGLTYPGHLIPPCRPHIDIHFPDHWMRPDLLVPMSGPPGIYHPDHLTSNNHPGPIL